MAKEGTAYNGLAERPQKRKYSRKFRSHLGDLGLYEPCRVPFPVDLMI
jgi:hypothetical protein